MHSLFCGYTLTLTLSPCEYVRVPLSSYTELTRRNTLFKKLRHSRHSRNTWQRIATRRNDRVSLRLAHAALMTRILLSSPPLILIDDVYYMFILYTTQSHCHTEQRNKALTLAHAQTILYTTTQVTRLPQIRGSLLIGRVHAKCALLRHAAHRLARLAAYAARGSAFSRPICNMQYVPPLHGTRAPFSSLNAAFSLYKILYKLCDFWALFLLFIGGVTH